MVLSSLVGELCLQKEILARDYSCLVSHCQSLADSLFEVMASLVGGVNGAKTGAERELDEGRSTIFLPGSAVQEIRDGG